MSLKCVLAARGRAVRDAAPQLGALRGGCIGKRVLEIRLGGITAAIEGIATVLVRSEFGMGRPPRTAAPPQRRPCFKHKMFAALDRVVVIVVVLVFF